MSREVKLDILIFWKSKQCQYPVLSHIARDILAIPISTVASESAFWKSKQYQNGGVGVSHLGLGEDFFGGVNGKKTPICPSTNSINSYYFPFLGCFGNKLLKD